MKNVYLAIKDGGVIIHADKQAMFDLDGIEEPDMTVTEEEFYAADGLVRIIDDIIVLGKTAAEKAEEEKLEKIKTYKTELAAIDQEAGAGRAVRGLALAAAKKAGVKYEDGNEDFDRLQDWENIAEPLRKEIKQLMNTAEIQPALPDAP
jgi:hypothetical protein